MLLINKTAGDGLRSNNPTVECITARFNNEISFDLDKGRRKRHLSSRLPTPRLTTQRSRRLVSLAVRTVMLVGATSGGA